MCGSGGLTPVAASRRSISNALDAPETFRRDGEKQRVKRNDLKVCEIAAIAEDELLVLERASETSKIYRVRIDERDALPSEHLRVETRPTVEELSAGDA